MQHICKKDIYVSGTEGYWVKSLYFDTCDDRYYYENQAGVDDRKKYRIRVYDNNADAMKLECKYSRRNMKAKESCRIDRQQYEDLTGRVPVCRENYEGLLGRFQAEQKMDLLVPKVIVEYRRSPYTFAAGNVRITFDRNIRSSCHVTEFLNKNLAYRSVLPESMNILEVKFDEFLPAAIRELLAVGNDLRRTSFSKYTLCRECGIR